MKFDLDGVLLVVASVTLTPVIADCVGEDVAVLAEACGNNAAANFGITL